MASNNNSDAHCVRLLVSGKGEDVMFPPNLSPLKAEINQTSDLSEENGVDLSSDFQSFSSDNGRLVVFGPPGTHSLCCSAVQPEQSRTSESAPVPTTEKVDQNQQASIKPSKPHSPEQDSSPNQSMEQGSRSCFATSGSTHTTQYECCKEEEYYNPEMSDPVKRLQTYIDKFWTLPFPSKEQLTKANMYYEGIRIITDDKGVSRIVLDQVVCCKCGRTFCQWQPGDDPVAEHWRLYPDCFLKKWEKRNN